MSYNQDDEYAPLVEGREDDNIYNSQAMGFDERSIARKSSFRSNRLSIKGKGDAPRAVQPLPAVHDRPSDEDSFQFDLALNNNIARLRQNEQRNLSLKSITSPSVSPSPRRESLKSVSERDRDGSSSGGVIRTSGEKTPDRFFGSNATVTPLNETSSSKESSGNNVSTPPGPG